MNVSTPPAGLRPPSRGMVVMLWLAVAVLAAVSLIDMSTKRQVLDLLMQLRQEAHDARADAAETSLQAHALREMINEFQQPAVRRRTPKKDASREAASNGREAKAPDSSVN